MPYTKIKMFIKIETSGPSRTISQSTIRESFGWYRVSSATFTALLRIRNDYPVTYCQKEKNGDIRLGYGAAASSLDDEYLRIVIKHDGSLEVERDVICTLPLYYGYDGKKLVISNDFHEVCASLEKLTPNIEHISSAFHKFTDMWDTLFAEVNILGERQRLTFQKGLMIHQPPPRLWTHNAELLPTDPRQFVYILQKHLDTFFETRLAGSLFTFEVSGGLDSCLLPLYLSTKSIGPLTGYSLIMPGGDMRERQLNKLHAVSRAARMQLSFVQLDDAYDLMPALLPDAGDTFLPTMHGIYSASYMSAIAQMHGRGVRVIVCGLSGDQMFEHTPPQDVYNLAEEFSKHRAEFAGPSLHYSKIKVPPTLLSPNTVIENSSLANNYIRHDIWPVSPFQNLGLFNFCQALPIQYRANKNILRAYYQAAQFPSLLYTGSNEDYYAYFKNILSNGVVASRVANLSKGAYTEAVGLVDTSKIRKLYDQVSRQGEDPENKLYYIYDWINIEQNLRLSSR